MVFHGLSPACKQTTSLAFPWDNHSGSVKTRSTTWVHPILSHRRLKRVYLLKYNITMHLNFHSFIKDVLRWSGHGFNCECMTVRETMAATSPVVPYSMVKKANILLLLWKKFWPHRQLCKSLGDLENFHTRWKKQKNWRSFQLPPPPPTISSNRSKGVGVGGNDFSWEV